MFYLRVTAVPTPRDTNPINSPIAEMAARLTKGEYCELRFVRKGGETCCYLGFKSSLQTNQAKNLLSLNGYLYKEEFPPHCAETEILLHREVERRLVVRAAATEEVLIPRTIESDSSRANALFQCFSTLSDGMGISFLIKRAEPLPQGTASHLYRSNLSDHSFFHQMLNSNITFEMVGAVFGAKKELPFLLAETLYTYSGLSAIPIKTSPINSDLFSLLGDNISVTPPLKPLCKIYFKSELDILGDLSRSAGEHGLRINKDTIFGIPRVASKLETPTIRLGLAASGTPLEMPLNKLSQHMFMGGAPGSGKSNELFFLISQLHKNKIPTLIIEGAKAEFHHLRKTIPELRVWRPEEGSYVCNPFSLQGDITLGEMRDALLQTMRVCFKMEGPLEELFSRTLNNCFVKNGFSDSSKLGDVGVTPFGLSEFIQEFRHILNESGYSGRTRADIKTAGDVRLASLFNRNRGVYDSCASIPVEEMLNGYNLIQLNSLTTVEGKQMFASLLLIAISAYLRLRGKHSGGELKLAIILDESHNLLQPVSDSEGHEYPFARDFSNMLLELRASGVGLVICDQSADNLPSELVKSCQTKVFLGSLLSSGVGNYTSYLGADETSLKYLYLLGAGEGIFVTEKMPEAKYFCSPNVIQLFRLDDANYEIKNDFLEKHPRLTLETFRECASCPASGKCKHPHKIAARRISAVLCQKYGYHLEHLLEKQHEEGVLTKISNTLTRILVDIYHDTENNECLRYCTVVQFVREFNRQHSDALSVENLINNGETIWKNLDKKNSEKGVIL